jgi:hypothetical protein
MSVFSQRIRAQPLHLQQASKAGWKKSTSSFCMPHLSFSSIEGARALAKLVIQIAVCPVRPRELSARKQM